MRWKAKYTKAEYKPGTTRLKRVFAFIPTYINGEMVWLETYDVLQVYHSQQYNCKLPDLKETEESVFNVCRWVNLSKRTIPK